MEGQAYIYIYISITKASKVPTQIFSLVRWFGPPMLLTGEPTVHQPIGIQINQSES